MSDTELTTSTSDKSKSLKMYSNKSIKVLNTKLNINASKVTFSNEITVFFVDSYKKYNKLPPQYEEQKIDIKRDIRKKRQKNEITCNQCIIF